jgi:hypothetical protein
VGYHWPSQIGLHALRERNEKLGRVGERYGPKKRLLSRVEEKKRKGERREVWVVRRFGPRSFSIFKKSFLFPWVNKNSESI